MSISKEIPQLATNKNKNINSRLLDTLIMSHKHLTAINMVPVYAKKEIEGEINKNSAVFIRRKKKDLINKKFIYDEFTNINDSWEYNIVTIIE